jgi:hypothetical protein
MARWNGTQREHGSRRSRAAWAVGLLAALLAVLTLAGVAAAKVRSGSANDPREASLAADRDIESASASYNDLTGAFSVVVRFYGPVVAPTSAAESVGVTIDFGPQSGGTCGTARPNGVTFAADSSPDTTIVLVSSPRFTNPDTAKKSVSSDRRELRIAYTKKLLAGMDLRCAQVTVRQTGSTSFDQLDTPIFFPGPFTTVTPACLVPKVVGKTLGQAKVAITRAGCAMGKVVRVRSTRVKVGRVVSQRPTAGRKLALGSFVALNVSRGRR